MALDQSALLEVLTVLKNFEASERIRHAAETIYQALIEAELTAVIGAAPNERTPDRLAQRNGHRSRTLTTTAGDLELQIPKLRTGSFFPSLLERRRRVDQALFAVVMEAYLHGVSTRKVDDLVKALGADTGISKSEVSRICADLDEEVAAFRDRSLADQHYPYLFLDATYCKARVNRRVVSQAVIVATGVTADGRREVIGFAVGDSEDGAFWTAFLRSLKARGLAGVQLVISDAHAGLVASIRAVLLDATWQRCRVHWSRKESKCRFCDTWVVVVRCDGVQERVGAGVSGCGSGDGVGGLLQQRANPELGVADGSSAHLKQFGYDLPGADFAHAEDDRQDALGVGDFSWKMPPRVPACRSPPRWRCLRCSASAACRSDSRSISAASSGRLIPVSAGSPSSASRFGRVGTVLLSRKSRSALALVKRSTVGSILSLRAARSLPVSVTA
ncbi:hypothetical protein HD596_006121 [Nonomuraea jabiensis]|uniref:Mutator family transposase n=1 Tax=Nonomuraea jabiensis TaxID=882448 RepID=A0A7W9LD26_9ACTN|nr:hypothetical protein [Nonomuraea jabiensis]